MFDLSKNPGQQDRQCCRGACAKRLFDYLGARRGERRYNDIES
jgi:hypothetical protein